MFTNSMNVLQYVSIWVYLIQNAGTYTPRGYLGCYEDSMFRILNGKVNSLELNSGDFCKRVCKGFRYAGTEAGSECYCGNRIRIKQERNDCNHDCPGNRNEKCGGDWRISIYDTWPCANLAPCKNHATCVNINADNYICLCSGNWTGMHCDEVKTSPTTATTTTTLATTEATSGHITNLTTSLSTNSKGGINGTDFQDIVKDDDENLLIVLYVLLPLAVIVAVIVLAIFLQRQHRKKQVQVLYRAQGSLPNIYANLASINNSPLVNAHIHADNAVARRNFKVGAKVKDIDAEEEMEYYEHLYDNWPVENTDGCMHSYDHVSTLKKSAVNKTYSKLSETNTDNKCALNTNYSHIDTRYGEHGVIDDSRDDDVTYNRLDMKHVSEDGPRNVDCDTESEYDHTSGGHVLTHSNIETDDYSHLNDRDCDTESEYDHTSGGHVLTHSNMKTDDYSHLNDRDCDTESAYDHSSGGNVLTHSNTETDDYSHLNDREFPIM